MINEELRERWFQDADGWRFDMPTGWMQGRSVFGGLTAAAAVALGMRHVDTSRRLRTLNVQLLRPVVAGVVRGTCVKTREGKNISFLEVRLTQNESLVAIVNLIVVVPRASKVRVELPMESIDASPDDLKELPYVPGLTPEFTQHVSMRWATGSPPFQNDPSRSFTGFCRFRGEAGGVEGVIGLLDVWPSPTLSMLSKPAFASTVMWTAHIASVPTFDDWFRFTYETAMGEDGYHTAVGKLHDAKGNVVGWTEQLVVVFDNES
ncbi:MAG: thioesterase family protein [Myxococcota bacterium]